MSLLFLIECFFFVMIKPSNYVTILAPMVTDLGLKGNELLIFALIHGFSQDDIQSFQGSVKYIQEWTLISKPSVYKSLQKLVEKGYIKKYDSYQNSIKHCEYKSCYNDILEVVKKLNQGGKESLPGVVKKVYQGGKETLPYINKDTTNLYSSYKNTAKVSNNLKIDNPELIKLKSMFEEFRSLYMGKKGGLDTEWNHFIKKTKDYKEVCPLLVDCVKNEIDDRESKLSRKEFVPQWKNLETYINKRAWELYIFDENDQNSFVSIQEQAAEQQRKAIETLNNVLNI